MISNDVENTDIERLYTSQGYKFEVISMVFIGSTSTTTNSL